MKVIDHAARDGCEKCSCAPDGRGRKILIARVHSHSGKKTSEAALNAMVDRLIEE